MLQHTLTEPLPGPKNHALLPIMCAVSLLLLTIAVSDNDSRNAVAGKRSELTIYYLVQILLIRLMRNDAIYIYFYTIINIVNAVYNLTRATTNKNNSLHSK